MIKKIIIGITAIMFCFILFFPPMVYYYTLSLADTKPVKPTDATLTIEQLNAIWKEHEPDVAISNVCKITPYWIYKWVFAAFVNDLLSINVGNFPYGNTSVMASQIAINHMRTNGTRTKGMGMWHLLHINLSIWVQRHWSPEELAVKYIEITHNKPLKPGRQTTAAP